MTVRHVLLAALLGCCACGPATKPDAGTSGGGGGGTTMGGGGGAAGGGTTTGGGAGGGATGGGSGGGGGVAGDAGCPGGTTLDLSTGAVTVLGDLTTAPLVVSTSCGTGAHHDVFHFNLATQQDVFVQISSATWQPVISLWSGASCASELRCSAANLQGATSITGVALPPGTWSIVVDSTGSAPVGAYDLYVTRPSATYPPVTNGTPIANLAGTRGLWRYFSFTVDGGTPTITATLSGGTGNADLYLSGGQPTTTAYLQASRDAGTAESVTQPTATAGEWFVGVYAKETFSGVTLTATW